MNLTHRPGRALTTISVLVALALVGSTKTAHADDAPKKAASASASKKDGKKASRNQASGKKAGKAG